MSQNHWSEISGSTRRPERCECGTSWTYGCVPEMSPCSRSSATTASARLVGLHPAEALRRGVGDAAVLADHA